MIKSQVWTKAICDATNFPLNQNGLNLIVEQIQKDAALAPVRVQPVGPLESCIRLERLLRGMDVYYTAMDSTCKLGLGKWLKRIIRNAKRPTPHQRCRPRKRNGQRQ